MFFSAVAFTTNLNILQTYLKMGEQFSLLTESNDILVLKNAGYIHENRGERVNGDYFPYIYCHLVPENHIQYNIMRCMMEQNQQNYTFIFVL